MREREGFMTDERLVLTDRLIEEFFESMSQNGRQAETVKVYRRALAELLDFLPEDCAITAERLDDWKDFLERKGYAPSTINLWASAVNSLMRHCGYDKARLHHTQLKPKGEQPELSRPEYLSFLKKVREIGTEQEYLLIKVFATMNMTIRELPSITEKAVREGKATLSNGRVEEIPCCLQAELTHYVKKNDITGGPVFVTRSGNPLDRSNIAKSIRVLAGKAGLSQEKCCPRSLHRMYQRTRDDIWKGLEAMYEQSYDSLLNTEQLIIGWEGQ